MAKKLNKKNNKMLRPVQTRPMLYKQLALPAPMTCVNPGPVSTSMQPGPIQTKRTQIPGLNFSAQRKAQITPQGVDWLKLAFAAPDFPVLAPRGIPDKYTGRTLPAQFRYTEDMTIPPTGRIIVVPPIPGYAYFALDTKIEDLDASYQYVGRAYPEALGLFPRQANGGTPTGSDVVTAFRYMSQLVELVPTTNQFNWSGNIRAFKLPVRLTDSILLQDVVVNSAGEQVQVRLPAYTKQVTGLEGVGAVLS